MKRCVPVNKTGLVNEVKDRLGVSTAKAKTIVEAVVGEIASAVAQGEAITMRGFGFTPESDKNWAAATDKVTKPSAGKPAKKAAARKLAAPAAPAAEVAPAESNVAAEPTTPTEPHIVPYEPMRDPDADALAAVAAEQARPELVAEPFDESTRVVSTMPEPELLEEPDTLAYSSGDADPDETIGERTGEAG
jgi:nucleoid DNA-binding protein